MTEMFLIDKNITLFLFNLLPRHWSLDYFFSFLSLQGYSFLIWLIISIIVIFLEEKKYPGISKKDKKFIFTFTLSLFVTFLIVYGIKEVIQRPRPNLTIFNQSQLISTNFNCPKDFSFPSGHAAISFAAASVLACFDKKRKWFYYGIAVLISFSRLYLGCHFLFDILAGGVMGYMISKIFIQISSLIFPHYKT